LSRLMQGQGVECSRVHKINKYSGHTFRPVEIAESMLGVLEQ